MLAIVAFYSFSACTVILSKMLLWYTKPLFLTGSRNLVGGLILLAYQYWYAHHTFKFQRNHIWMYAQVMVLGIVAVYTLRYWALTDIPAAKVLLFYNLSPFFSAFYSYIFFKETMTRYRWLGLAIGCMGLIPILMTTSPLEKLNGEFLFISWQELAALASVAFHNYSWIVMRKLIRDEKYTPMMINGICMTGAGIISLFLSTTTEGILPITQPVPFLILTAAMVILSNIFCHNLHGYLLGRYTTTLLAFASFLSPMFAAIYSAFFFNEPITWHLFASIGIVSIGLYIFYHDELRNGNIVQQTS